METKLFAYTGRCREDTLVGVIQATNRKEAEAILRKSYSGSWSVDYWTSLRIEEIPLSNEHPLIAVYHGS